MTPEEEIARKIVTDWLSTFDPPPQIDFMQSEILQQIIVDHLIATREVVAELASARQSEATSRLRNLAKNALASPVNRNPSPDDPKTIH